MHLGPQGPHWEITPKEAKDLDAAWAKMWRHFAPQVSEKTADIINFGQVAGRIVAPRAVQSAFDRYTRTHAHARGQAPQPPAAPAPAPQQAGPPPPVLATVPGQAPPPPRAGEPQTPSQQDPLSMSLSHMSAGRA